MFVVLIFVRGQTIAITFLPKEKSFEFISIKIMNGKPFASYNLLARMVPDFLFALLSSVNGMMGNRNA